MTSFPYVSEIPERKYRHAKNWKSIFENIPKGKAVIIPCSFARSQNVRKAVLKFNKKTGANLDCTVRNSHKDNEETYVFRRGEF